MSKRRVKQEEGGDDQRPVFPSLDEIVNNSLDQDMNAEEAGHAMSAEEPRQNMDADETRQKAGHAMSAEEPRQNMDADETRQKAKPNKHERKRRRLAKADRPGNPSPVLVPEAGPSRSKGKIYWGVIRAR